MNLEKVCYLEISTDVIWALEQWEFAAKTAIGLGASVKFLIIHY
jgi:hypothetical protein